MGYIFVTPETIPEAAYVCHADDFRDAKQGYFKRCGENFRFIYHIQLLQPDCLKLYMSCVEPRINPKTFCPELRDTSK